MEMIEILDEMLQASIKSDKETVEELLERIPIAYEICRERAPKFPAEAWQKDENIMPFAQGNHKLPKTTWIINLGTSGLCPGRALGTCKCCGVCYAHKAETQYKEGTIAYRLLQTIRWRKLSAEQIAEQLLKKHRRAKEHKMKALRFNESGDVFDESDILKMSKIADILSEEGIVVYTYSSRKDLDWSKKSSNLVVNGSGWMCDNQFQIVEKHTDDMEYQCHGDCDTCDYCKIAKGVIIYVEEH